jgi:hypothetical protein
VLRLIRRHPDAVSGAAVRLLRHSPEIIAGAVVDVGGRTGTDITILRNAPI